MIPRSSFDTVLANVLPTAMTGTVLEIRGVTIHAAGFPAPLGAVAEIVRPQGGNLLAEVVGFRDGTAILYPYTSTHGIRRGNRVRLRNTVGTLKLSDGVLGRILDALGNPVDGETVSNPLETSRIPLQRELPKAHERPRIDTPLSTGVRAIDGLLTLGRGQRIGIFAGSGVGKSVLLGMMARYTSADVVVIGLIGERGREVNDLIERDLGLDGLRRSVVITATSDESAILRVRAAQTATAVAEYFRDRGKNVLLLMDSLTRFAMAQREIGLAASEPATRNGYPPSVLAMLPALVERTGRTQIGTITAIYTVLVEGEDKNDLIADTVRGLLDGHIWLSRSLAEKGHYPAIDVPSSVSRLMPDICTPEHLELAARVKKMIAVWRDHEELVSIGVYKKGAHPELDEAISHREATERFLCQNVAEASNIEQSIAAAQAIFT